MPTTIKSPFQVPIPVTDGGTGATSTAAARASLGITIGARDVIGTASEIVVTNGDGSTGNPTIGFATDAVMPGSGALTVPTGTTLQQPAFPVLGMIRSNTDTNTVEIYESGIWTTLNPSGFVNLTGPITSVGNATSIASQTGIGTTFVVDDSPTLITPDVGAATATSVNKVAITAPATSATLTIADGNTLTQNNTLTYSGIDGSLVDFGAGGTVSYVSNAFSSIVTQVFASSGTYTPTANMKYCVIEVIGAGGGGGGVTGAAGQSATASGGGAGGYARESFDAATIGVSQAVIIGAGGAGGVAGNNPGAAGGSTSVGALLSATGGAGGLGGAVSVVSASGGTPGTGGAGAGGNVNTVGQPGSRGIKITTTVSNSGAGGSSVYGSGGVSVANSTDGAAAGNYGSGGSGAASVAAPARPGGAGSSGLVIVTEYI